MGLANRIAGIVAGLLALSDLASAEKALKEFVLRDYLNRQWTNELVTYKVKVPAPGADLKTLRLRGPDGELVPVQVAPVSKNESGRATEVSISFKASIAPFGSSTYSLVETTAEPPATDLKTGNGRKGIRLESALVGIEIPSTTKRAAGGPISGFRLRSGKWIGKGNLQGRQVKEYEVEVLTEGPVFAEARCRYTFADDTSWEIVFRVIAGEPVVLITESFDFADPKASWVLQLNEGVTFDTVDYRSPSKVVSEPLPETKEDPVFRLAPFRIWTPNEGYWCGLSGEGSDDFLFVGSRDGSKWARELPRSMDPWTRCWRMPEVRVPLRATDGRQELVFPFPRDGRARLWMLAAWTKQEARRDDKPEPPKQLAIKYGQVPLDLVKDYVLEWPGREKHPRLYVTEKDLGEVRKAVSAGRATGRWDEVLHYLAKGDEKLGRKIAQESQSYLQAFVDRFAKQDKVLYRGWAPHQAGHQAKAFINYIDTILDAPFVTDEERAVMRAQLAFAAYQMASPDTQSPDRGWSANPNMTCAWYSCLGDIACLISSHPMAKEWFARAYREVRLELDTWAGPNGGWLEAPHYAAVSIDFIVPLAIAARNTGMADFLYDPKLKNAVRYLGKIATPPDPDCGGRRIQPAIGNTYHSETTGQTGWLAKLYAERDPEYSQEMQWVWTQQGRPMHSGIGGASPGLKGYWPVYTDPGLPMRAPEWDTELFPSVGVIFRNAFNTPRETYLFFRHGPFAEHWDRDEGSIMLYAKGKPLMRDWSYNPYTPHGWLHNRVVNNHADGSNGQGEWNEYANLRAFAKLGHVDYARSWQRTRAGDKSEDYTKKRGKPLYEGEWPFAQSEPNGDLTWERQVLFVRDDDPSGPAYFVFGDTTKGETWIEWCMWFCASKAPDLSKNPIEITGQYDVDARLFLAMPKAPKLSTLHAEQDGLGPKISQELVHFAQRAGTPIVSVLYPFVRGEESPPTFTSIADGNGISVQGAFGQDLHVVSRRELEVKDAGLQFKGRVVSVQDRPKRLTLSLPEGGELIFGAYQMIADGAVSVDALKDRNEMVVHTDGTARTIRMKTPIDPEDWEGSSQNADRAEDGELIISLPVGWKELRLRAPD